MNQKTSDITTLEESMKMVASLNNLNLIPFQLDTDSLLYLQVFYEFENVSKYLIIRFWASRVSPNLTLGEFRFFIDELITNRFSRIFSHKTTFTKIRAYNVSRTIDTGDLYLSNSKGRVETGLMQNLFTFVLQTFSPSTNTKFKLYGLASPFKNINSINVFKETIHNFIAFKTLFVSPITYERQTITLKCVGVHTQFKRKNNKFRPINENTYVVDLVPEGMNLE